MHLRRPDEKTIARKLNGTPLAEAASVACTAPLSVAIVMTGFEPGGTERQMIELVRRLSPARWNVHVACFHARGTWFGRVANAAASVAEFPITSFQKPSVVRQAVAFGRWCRAHRIAIVHTTELYSNIFALPAAALANVPVRIGNRREINPDKTPAQIALQRAAYACAHTVVANSHAAARRLALEGVPARKIAVVPNGVDLQPLWPKSAPVGGRTIIVVANLRPEKGHDVLIDAAAHVLHRFPDARFEVVGDGPERGRLTALAAARALSRSFSFLGHRDDVAARLGSSDIFVLPSRSEAFPNAVLEAMAAGLPIVASAVGGIPELIDDGRSGLLVPAGDPAALAERLCRLLADAPLAVRLGEAARAKAEAHDSFDRMVASFESLYLALLTRRGVVGAARPQLAAS
jgi:glycosyltransferase involved in cell wall biosynthesis